MTVVWEGEEGVMEEAALEEELVEGELVEEGGVGDVDLEGLS